MGRSFSLAVSVEPSKDPRIRTPPAPKQQEITTPRRTKGKQNRSRFQFSVAPEPGGRAQHRPTPASSSRSTRGTSSPAAGATSDAGAAVRNSAPGSSSGGHRSPPTRAVGWESTHSEPALTRLIPTRHRWNHHSSRHTRSAFLETRS